MYPTLALTAAVLCAPPPAFRATEPVAALGAITAGPPRSHTFTLTNAGRVGVVITGVEAGCGCVRRRVAAERLAAGESTTLTVEINTLTQPDGPNRWPLRVRYESGPLSEPGTLDLALTANLSREVSVTPPQLALSGATAMAGTITLSDRRAKPLTVIRATVSAPYLSATVDGRTVRLAVAADAPAGSHDEAVTIFTDDPAYPEFRVPVRVTKSAAGGVVASPSEVDLHFAPGQAEASALVQVRAAGGGPVQVTAVECDNPAVKTRWSTGSGPVATVRLTVAAQPGGRADVRVRVGDTPVVVPVTWTAP